VTRDSQLGKILRIFWIVGGLGNRFQLWGGNAGFISEVAILPGGSGERRKVVEAEREVLLAWVKVTV